MASMPLITWVEVKKVDSTDLEAVAIWSEGAQQV